MTKFLKGQRLKDPAKTICENLSKTKKRKKKLKKTKKYSSKVKKLSTDFKTHKAHKLWKNKKKKKKKKISKTRKKQKGGGIYIVRVHYRAQLPEDALPTETYKIYY